MAKKNALPKGNEQWLKEVAAAYVDACEVLPLMEGELDEGDLYSIGPNVCFKFRGLELSPKEEQRATDAAVGSFMATEEGSGPFEDPEMAFAFTYIAAHFALDLIEEEQATEILEFIEENLPRLRGLTFLW